MKTNQEIKAIANGLYAETTEGFARLAEVKKDAVGKMLKKKGADRADDIMAIVTDIEAVLAGARCENVGLPKFLAKVTYDGDTLETINLNVRTKLKSAFHYRKDAVIAVDKNIIENLSKVYTDALFEMYYIEAAIENVEALNAKVAEIIEQAGVPYTFKFAVDNETSAMVLSINDSEVVFNANVACAHDIANLGIFKSGDEYDNLVCAATTEKLITALKAAQTPVQLIKGNVQLIKDVTGVSTKKRASKLIRGSYHRQAKFLSGVKAGIGYFDETVKIGGEDVDVFALVSKSEDGNLSVVLSPFDTKTLFGVKFDVLKEVKKQMSAA